MGDPKTSSNVVPFGKYKGQPVEALAQDRQYIEWLMGQAWFRERYGNFYTLIVNNFQEPTETPEHNAMQVEFLDDEFCRRFIAAAVLSDSELESEIDRHIQQGEPEKARIEKIRHEWRYAQQEALYGEAQKEYQGREFYENLLNEAPKRATKAVEDYKQHRRIPIASIDARGFEVKGWDVLLQARFHVPDLGFGKVIAVFVELKPSMGDDYPAVLRQMKARPNTGYQRAVLLIGDYVGRGATLEQVRRIFNASEFKLIVRNEI